jgi:hypothetical protein
MYAVAEELTGWCEDEAKRVLLAEVSIPLLKRLASPLRVQLPRLSEWAL